MTHGSLRLDADRLSPPKRITSPKRQKPLYVSLFSYYSQWIAKFSEEIRPLVMAELFPLNQEA